MGNQDPWAADALHLLGDASAYYRLWSQRKQSCSRASASRPELSFSRTIGDFAKPDPASTVLAETGAMLGLPGVSPLDTTLPIC